MTLAHADITALKVHESITFWKYVFANSNPIVEANAMLNRVTVKKYSVIVLIKILNILLKANKKRKKVNFLIKNLTNN